MIKRHAVFAGLAGAAVAMVSCADLAATQAAPPDATRTAGNAGAAQPGARIMLKLGDPKVAVDAPATLASLGRICKCELRYVRAVSGDVHLLTLVPSPGSSADDALALLRANPSVLYADRDHVRHTM